MSMFILPAPGYITYYCSLLPPPPGNLNGNCVGNCVGTVAGNGNGNENTGTEDSGNNNGNCVGRSRSREASGSLNHYTQFRYSYRFISVLELRFCG